MNGIVTGMLKQLCKECDDEKQLNEWQMIIWRRRSELRLLNDPDKLSNDADKLLKKLATRKGATA